MHRVFIVLAGLMLAYSTQAQPFVWPNTWSADALEIQALILQEGTKPTMRFRDATLSGPRTFNSHVSSEDNDVVNLEVGLGARLLILDIVSETWLPWAANSYEMTGTAQGLEARLTLRDGLKWSNGEDITIEQYLATYEIETNPEGGWSSYDSWFIDGKKIELSLTEDNELLFNFPVKDRIAPTLIAYYLPTPQPLIDAYRQGGMEGAAKAIEDASGIMSLEDIETAYNQGAAEALKGMWGTETDPSELVTSAPFILERYVPDERLIFKRNPYWGDWNVDERDNPLPYIDELQYTIADQQAQLNLYLAGEIDAYNPANLDELGAIAVAIDNGDMDAELLENISPVRSSSFYVFNWNYASDPFKENVFRDARFRRAMSHLTDRAAIVELVNGSAAIPAYGMTYQVLDFWYNNDIPIYDFDPDKALELLAEMGFTEKNDDGFLIDADGNELGFTLATNSGNANREQTIQILADTMREYGINVTPSPQDFNLLVDQLLSTGDDRPWEAIYISLSGGAREWPYGTNTLVCEGNLHMYNQSGKCMTDEERAITQLYSQGRQTLDNDTAQAIAYEMQGIHAALQPQIYTVTPLAHYSWLSKIKGEHPMEYLNTVNGPRKIPLAFVSDADVDLSILDADGESDN